MDPQQPPAPQPGQPGPPQQPPAWSSPPPNDQPAWSGPPQQQTGWGQTGYSTPPPRPGGVTFAGIFLIIMGVLALLAALLLFAGGSMVGGLGAEMGDAAGLFSGIFTVIAVIALIWGIAQIAGGVGALQGKSWGRITGIVVSVIAVIFSVLGLLAALTPGGADGAAPQTDAGGLVINLIVVVLYALAAWALIKAGPYFAYRR